MLCRALASKALQGLAPAQRLELLSRLAVSLALGACHQRVARAHQGLEAHRAEGPRLAEGVRAGRPPGRGAANRPLCLLLRGAGSCGRMQGLRLRRRRGPRRRQVLFHSEAHDRAHQGLGKGGLQSQVRLAGVILDVVAVPREHEGEVGAQADRVQEVEAGGKVAAAGALEARPGDDGLQGRLPAREVAQELPQQDGARGATRIHLGVVEQLVQQVQLAGQAGLQVQGVVTLVAHKDAAPAAQGDIVGPAVGLLWQADELQLARAGAVADADDLPATVNFSGGQGESMVSCNGWHQKIPCSIDQASMLQVRSLGPLQEPVLTAFIEAQALAESMHCNNEMQRLELDAAQY